VLTSNWDPFPLDAYQRNRNAVSLPEIFFVRGNVRTIISEQQGISDALIVGDSFPTCDHLIRSNKRITRTPPHISRGWETAE
jgi:hypothetical protein